MLSSDPSHQGDEMIKPSILGRGAFAVLVSLLAVGTVLATSPAPSSSAGSSHALGAPPVQTADKTAEPTKSPKAAETAEPAEASEPVEAAGAALTDSQAAPFVAKLKAAGIAVSLTEFKALAAKVGVGGAVRVLAFAKASGKSTTDLLAMFQGGKGWGEIAHTLGLHPGIGWIMSGRPGKGQGHAAGADKTKGSDDSGS
jgi:hypothetical protein